jgi:GntR family carbon starvation induced transcriptional regulator
MASAQGHIDTSMTTPSSSAATTLATSVSLKIRADIINGILRPGDKLHTSALGKRYDISLVPLREALSRLASTGFVVAEDQRGFRVAEISAEELLDITRTRIFIEKEALRRSMLHGDVAWESELIAAHHRLARLRMLRDDKDGLTPEWEKAHAQFHEALLAACDSKWLLSMAGMLRDQTARYRHLSTRASTYAADGAAPPPKRDVHAEHQMLLDAVLDRNAERACQLLEEHFNTTTQLVMRTAF